MANRFTGKVVIVTGSSAGIGQDAAVEFGKEGASVVIHGQNVKRLDKTHALMVEAGVSPEKIHQVIGSLEDPDTPAKIILQAVSKFGKIDVLVNNAGASSKPNEKDPDSLENLDFLFKVNFRSVVELTQLAIPYLEKTKGNVVNVGSVGGARPYHSFTFYCSLKATLDHFTKCYADKYGHKGIRINSLNPGPIKTHIIARGVAGLEGTPELVQKLDEFAAITTSVRRIGQCSEMSNILLFLASDQASYVTGANWLADGGAALQSPNFIDYLQQK
uniref:Uncharacterized protein n=1 Tax=Ditylenchus dipsaci TaxID=166011 RepID=A0A915DQZ0_9BILA